MMTKEMSGPARSTGHSGPISEMGNHLMKRWNRLAVLALSTLVTLGGTLQAQQAATATYSSEAMQNLVPLLQRGDNAGFRMEPATSRLFGGWLPRGNNAGNERWVPMLVMRDLEPANEYFVIAAGDNDAVDLDVRVLDPTGKVVGADSTTDKEAYVVFRPTRRQNYVIEMRLYNSRDNCVCIGAMLRR